MRLNLWLLCLRTVFLAVFFRILLDDCREFFAIVQNLLRLIFQIRLLRTSSFHFISFVLEQFLFLVRAVGDILTISWHVIVSKVYDNLTYILLFDLFLHLNFADWSGLFDSILIVLLARFACYRLFDVFRRLWHFLEKLVLRGDFSVLIFGESYRAMAWTFLLTSIDYTGVCARHVTVIIRGPCTRIGVRLVHSVILWFESFITIDVSAVTGRAAGIELMKAKTM